MDQNFSRLYSLYTSKNKNKMPHRMTDKEHLWWVNLRKFRNENLRKFRDNNLIVLLFHTPLSPHRSIYTYYVWDIMHQYQYHYNTILQMAPKSIPILCVLFLLLSASFIVHFAEGSRILEEKKDGENLSISLQHDIFQTSKHTIKVYMLESSNWSIV
jgi:hypothetical protein